MTGENQGNPQSLTDQRTDKTCIGVMGMDPVDPLARLREMLHELISQILQMRPEQLLTEITLWSKGKSKNASTRGNGLQRLAVRHIHPTVLDQSGHNIDLIHLSALGQAANQVKHIQRLTAGIGITTKLKIVGTDQTVKVQMQKTNPQVQSSKNSAATNGCRKWCLRGFQTQNLKRRLWIGLDRGV